MMKKVQDRFMFLSDQFFKFIQAKPKEGTKDYQVLFKCVQCKKGIYCSTASYSNLRRHINLKHRRIIKEFDDLWARNKRKRCHEESVPEINCKPETKHGPAFTDGNIREEDLDYPLFEEDVEFHDTFEDYDEEEDEEEEWDLKMKHPKGSEGSALCEPPKVITDSMGEGKRKQPGQHEL